MSVLDRAGKLEEQVTARLKELEPVVREYEQLRRVAERLGLDYSAAAAKPESEPVKASPAATRRRAAAKKRTASKSRGTAKPRATRFKRAAKSPIAVGGTQRPARTAQAETAAARPASSTPGAASLSATPAKRSSARKRAATGRRFDDVMRVVSANPGITLREVGQHLGLDATALYRVTKRLTDEGRLRKDNTRLYAIGSGAAAGPSEAGGGGSA